MRTGGRGKVGVVVVEVVAVVVNVITKIQSE